MKPEQDWNLYLLISGRLFYQLKYPIIPLVKRVTTKKKYLGCICCISEKGFHVCRCSLWITRKHGEEVGLTCARKKEVLLKKKKLINAKYIDLVQALLSGKIPILISTFISGDKTEIKPAIRSSSFMTISSIQCC